MRYVISRLCFISLILTITATLFAQSKDLKPEDYAKWQSIAQTELSPDGQWFSYNISLVEGDGWLAVKQVGSDDEHKFENSFGQQFSSNNRWFAFRIGIPEKEARQKRENQETIKYQLGLMDLHSTEVDTFSNIASYEFSDDGRFLIMYKYRPEESTIRGSDVILRDLENGTNQLFGNVAENKFNDDGTLLALLIDSHEKLGNGVHLVHLENMSIRVLESDETEYHSLTWSDDGFSLAFLKVSPEEEYKKDTHKVYAFTQLDTDPQKRVFDHSERDDFPEDTRVVEYRTLQWSEDGERLFFGIKEWTRDEKVESDPEENENDKVDDEEEEEEEDPDAHLSPTNVEIWHWRDDQIQPRQKVMSQSYLEANFLSVWHLEDDRFVQLIDDYNRTITLMHKQNYAVLYDPEPYQPRFRESWNDVYIVDVANGERRKVLERHESVRTSPGGEYLLYFLDDEWWSYNIPDDRHINLTQDIDTRFNNYAFISGRENDQPFGAGQWAEGDEWVLIYDEFDIYKANPDGSGVEHITHGAEDEIRYRQVRMNWEDPALDPVEPFYASMYGDRTKDRGYARIDRRGRTETLIYEPVMINRLSKADEADAYVYMSQTATNSPNFFYTDGSFTGITRLTDTNPQQEEYYWAGDELISFINDRGEELEGRLIYPANYQEGETYPMMVYIYERRSQTMHTYSMPDRTNPYNQRRFSSEGYFVFEPDITYELRRPGMSAVESVVPAVKTVIETGMIDEEKIGLTGHSWGGYQTNFIITQTDMFASAVAGAPLTNMISMYNSVYWNSGMPDATIFEISQGRFPDPYWQDWDNFIENSPIFNMENTKTPLLLKFGTDDGAVDFNQGVELYSTMRRMEKPFVMLVYEGENHSLGRRENQIDYATRAFEWHDHFILGKEPAEWIVNGLSYIERPEINTE